MSVTIDPEDREQAEHIVRTGWAINPATPMPMDISRAVDRFQELMRRIEVEQALARTP